MTTGMAVMPTAVTGIGRWPFGVISTAAFLIITASASGLTSPYQPLAKDASSPLGQSCFDAINDFIHFVSGVHVAISFLHK